MRPPKNFDNKMNRRKQLLPEVPQATADDYGKVVKVGESGAYELGEDENTIIIPNPDTTPSATLNALTIGSTTYKVNDARVTKLLGLRFTIDNGGTYNANLPQISIVNEFGEAAVLPTNTMTCDKPVQYGALTPTGTPGVKTENLPAKITLTFAAEFNIEDYPNIKLTKGALFSQDIAKNIKIEYTINDTDWVEIADLVSIDWTVDCHIYDMSTGEETETTPAIPTPTTADAGKFLGVDNTGAWELDNIPSELPAVTSADAGKVLTVDSQGAWGAYNKQVTVNVSVPFGGSPSLDRTMDEIIALFNSGTPMVFKHNTNVFILRNIDTTNKTMTITNFTTSASRLSVQAIDFNAQGVGTITSGSVAIS